MLDLGELRRRDFHAWIFSQPASTSQIVLTRPKPIEGLSPVEIMALAVVAGDAFTPDGGVAVSSCKASAERAGVTGMGVNLALRKLTSKRLVDMVELFDERNGETYPGLKITDRGWQWIEDNESHFLLLQQVEKKRKPGAFDTGEKLTY